MKKILALALAAIMTASLAVPAMALNTTNYEVKNGNANALEIELPLSQFIDKTGVKLIGSNINAANSYVYASFDNMDARPGDYTITNDITTPKKSDVESIKFNEDEDKIVIKLKPNYSYSGKTVVGKVTLTAKSTVSSGQRAKFTYDFGDTTTLFDTNGARIPTNKPLTIDVAEPVFTAAGVTAAQTTTLAAAVINTTPATAPAEGAVATAGTPAFKRAAANTAYGAAIAAQAAISDNAVVTPTSMKKTALTAIDTAIAAYSAYLAVPVGVTATTRDFASATDAATDLGLLRALRAEVVAAATAPTYKLTVDSGSLTAGAALSTPTLGLPTVKILTKDGLIFNYTDMMKDSDVGGSASDPVDFIVDFAKLDGTAKISFGEITGGLAYSNNPAFYFEVAVNNSSKLPLAYSTKANKEIVKLFPDADMQFYTFSGKPNFDYTGKARLFYDEDLFVYEVKADGTLVKIETTRDKDEDSYTFKTAVLGAYVTSKTELDVTKTTPAAPTTPATPGNPNTGASDFVGLAVALGAISLAAAAAVTLKK